MMRCEQCGLHDRLQVRLRRPGLLWLCEGCAYPEPTLADDLNKAVTQKANRGNCPNCGRDVALVKSGRLRAHATPNGARCLGREPVAR